MSDVAIRAEGLSKRFRIGERQKYKALRDTLADGLYSPFRAVASIVKGRKSLGSGQPSNSFIWALKDVSFEIKHGEVVGIVGRNGAGKSTLLRILSRITSPTAGYAEVKGQVGSLLEVGTGFHTELTGRENIYLNGAILGMRKKEIDRKFDEIVAFSEIEKFIDTPVKYYSSGMYVRLAFAVAAHMEPEILMVDEVLAVGDAAFQKKCLGKMGDAAKEGRTVLFVSHNMAAIGRLCGRCILLGNGRIAAEGHTRQVIDTYLSNLSSTEADVECGCDRAKAVQIRRIRLLDYDGRTTLELDRARPFRVLVEVEAHQEASNGEIAVSLETLDSVRICDSVSADEMEQYISFESGATYLAEVEFPGGMLNAGNYRFFVSVVSNHTDLDRQWGPVFRLINTGEFASYVGATYTAILLVKAQWQIRQK